VRGPARPVAHARATTESRSRQDLHSGAGGSISRLYRTRAQNAPGAGRRLSGDGSLARIFEVAPFASRAGGGAERRGNGERACPAPPPPGTHPPIPRAIGHPPP